MLDRRHFKNILLNTCGMLLPMAAGLLVVPDLLQRLGTDRFGVLSISWVLVGYFGVLDLGLARGLTQVLARQTAAKVSLAAQAAFARHIRRWMMGLGVCWAILLLALTPWLTHSGLQMPDAMRSEATLGWICLAISIPFFMWAACSIGVLEAHSRFATVNAVRIPMGVAIFLVPWILTFWSNHLGIILGGLLCVRVVAAFTFAALGHSFFTVKNGTVEPTSLKEILGFGGWLTVSNLVGPVLAYFDRFAIGALISVTAVTHYTVPFDVLSRLPAIPMAMMSVFFPLLAGAHSGVSPHIEKLHTMVRAANHLLVGIWIPGILACGLLGNTLLMLWVGPELAQSSSSVWAWIAVGVLINGFAHVPYTLLQSAGRTDLTAKFHLLELVPYTLALWWALVHFGITGAAAVWTLRVVVDTALLYGGAGLLYPALRAATVSAFAWTTGASLALAFGLYYSPSGAIVFTAQSLWFVLAALLWCVYHLRKLLTKPI